MDPARLQAIEEIFHAALEVEPAQRDAFLRERCAGDDALRRDVEVLLSADAGAGAFIEAPIAVLDAGLFAEDEPDRLVGQTIGHWEILRRIGSGGMGAVYLARRADRQYEQQVALKLIKRGMDTEAMLRRFRTERQILAGLDHPNIARLLDGDTTEDGLPYFVMEYVEGLPIDAYCDEHQLGTTARLQLFRQVCAAVSHAHRHAVIHRDLKCSNILVGADGVPKLLDFGIARLLQAEGGVEAPATMLEQRVMTPEYASPEHLRGESVTTASDVYSLGVVLYRLLTGKLPHRLKAQSVDDLARTVGQTEAQRPSAVVEPAHGRQLRGDLDNIVLMALRKEPERRYPSVEQFSEDIRRHLESLPVIARRDTLGYRAGKFVRRNTVASVAAVLVVLSLVGGIVATSWQAHRARTQEAIALVEKARAERRFNEVRQLARSVIFDYHDSIKDLTGATAIRERLVKDGLAYLDSLASEAGNDPELQRELAEAYDRVGDVRGGTYFAATLGDAAGARDSYMKALRIREALAAASPGDAQNRAALVASYERLGEQLIETGDAARGMDFMRKGLALQEQLAREQPQDSESQLALARTYSALGLALESVGDGAGSLESHRKSLAVREALARGGLDTPQLRRGLAIANINLGRALVLTGDIPGGIASNRKALELAQVLVAERPDRADHRRILGNTWQNDGDYRAYVHDNEAALRSFREKLVLDERALAEDPSNTVAHGDLAYTFLRMGYLLGELGRHGEALASYGKAVGLYEEAEADSSDYGRTRFNALLARAGVGEMQAHLGQRDAALAESSRVLKSLNATPADPAHTALSSLSGQVYMRVAATHAALGAATSLGTAERVRHWSEARDLYSRSLGIWQDMQRRGVLTGDDAAMPPEVARAIALCDEALRRLDG